MHRLVILVVLVLAPTASAGDGALLDAKEDYLPAVEARYADATVVHEIADRAAADAAEE